MRDPGKSEAREHVCARHERARRSRSVPAGNFIFYTDGDSVEEAVRRTLETCGALAGVACMIVAIDDVFVVPVPTIMKATGFFRAGRAIPRSRPMRETMWRANSRMHRPDGMRLRSVVRPPGMALKAASEQDAVNDALGNCAKRDSDCHVIAIGPFAVGPN